MKEGHTTSSNKAIQWWKEKSFQWWKDRIEICALTAAIGYAIVSYRQWRDLEHNFSLDERAWIRISAKKPDPTLDEAQKANMLLTVTNIGKSPASGLTIRVIGQILPDDASPTFDYKVGSISTSGILFQNDPIEITGGSTTDITQGQREDLAAGNAYLAVYGTAAFKDIFGKPHWTTFCLFRGFVSGSGKTVNAKTCTDYNNADSK